ncbi:MAG: hypothetical protein ACYDA5_09015 [Vulcanimicrobiaceae bacterium]
MLLFPPGPPVTLAIDGRVVPAFQRAYLSRGRVIGPLAPFLTAVADRIVFTGDGFIVSRGTRNVRVRLVPFGPSLLYTDVPLAPVLRGLGAQVSYDGASHTLEVTLPEPGPLRSPAPFTPAARQVAPRVVFTPRPVVTPRPIWTGSPRPRRTPIPASFWRPP